MAGQQPRPIRKPTPRAALPAAFIFEEAADQPRCVALGLLLSCMIGFPHRSRTHRAARSLRRRCRCSARAIGRRGVLRQLARRNCCGWCRRTGPRPIAMRRRSPRPAARLRRRRRRIAALSPVPIVTFAAGPAGGAEMIDNFGILVLTYVMLGWGLNIVVGLAGLLDLGYVAFYAVGAYSYALLATQFRPVVLDLPAARRHPRRVLGHLLGFPVLRLRGDYLAIVTLGFGEIIRLVLINWQSLTGGPNGIIRHSAARPFSAFRSPPAPNGFAAMLRASNSRRPTASCFCSI